MPSLARERAASGGTGGTRPNRDDVARRGRQEVQIRADRAATVAEIGRLDIEAGRYEAALAALDEAARQAPGNLPPREAGRIAYNRCESWFGLGRTDRCRELIEETAPLFSERPFRAICFACGCSRRVACCRTAIAIRPRRSRARPRR